MSAIRSIANTTILFVVFALLAAPAGAQDPARFFEDNCAMCHAIGGPPGAAPDLRDVSKRHDHAWLVRFILNPEETAKTDAAAAALIKQYDGNVMPATDGATAQTVEAVLRYIDGSGGTPPAAAAAVRQPTSVDLSVGSDLFFGRRALSRRAPSCASCHRAEAIGGLGGGTLGPDLTRVHERLGGASGLTNWLGNPPTKVTKAVFRSRPLDGDETYVIAAMLAAGGAGQSAAVSRTPMFIAIAAAIAIAALALAAAVWSRRMIAVRRPLVEAARGHQS
jgi:mono/diheme cytochrome c family protein